MPSRAFAVIYCRSVPESLEFYPRLGFEETFRLPPEGQPGYVSLRRGESELGLVSAEWPRDQLGISMGTEPRFEMFIYVDDVDATACELAGAVIEPPQDMPRGERVAYVRDPDGNPVALAAPTARRA